MDGVSDAHDLGVTACKFQDDANLISVGHDGEIKTWFIDSTKRAKTLICANEVKAHSTSILSFCMSAANNLLVTSSSDKTCKVWSLDNLGRPHLRKISVLQTVMVNFFLKIFSIQL